MKTLVILMAYCLLTFADMLAAVKPSMRQQYYFQTYDIRNGLSHNTVNTILQDQMGFMWFGTKDGLNRFDGTSFRVFNKENSTLKNNYVTKIFEDKEGNIWVGTDRGLFIYNPILDTFYSIKEYSGYNPEIIHAITEIKEDVQHNVWFSVDYEGLYKFNIKTHKLSRQIKTTTKGFCSANIAAFWFEGNTIWIDLYNDNLYYSTGNFRTFHPYKDKDGKMIFHKNIINQIEQRNQKVYLCTTKGLFEVDHANNSCRRLLDCYVRTLDFKENNELWAGTEQGLYICNLADRSVNHLTASNEYDPYALTDNAIYAVYRDKEGGMWIGSYFGGINYYPQPWSYFEKFYPRDNFNFLGRRIREFCNSNDGTIWIGTEDKGLFNFNPKTNIITPFTNHAIYSNIHGLCLDDHYLWVGTFSGGLNRVNLQTKAVKNYRQGITSNSLLSNDIFSICKTRRGELWIGTISGLLRYNRTTDDFTRIPGFTNKFIYNILEASNRDLWLATYANGVYRYDTRRNTWKNYVNDPKDKSSLPYNKVISIFQDSKGRLWFMTHGGGFCLYTPKNDKFIRFDMTDGFPSNIVYKMIEDDNGNLWLSTNKGLVCFNPDTHYRKVYTVADGLLSNQFNYQSGYKDKDGAIYMGSINGFIRFYPSTFKDNPVAASVYLTELYIFNKHVVVGEKGSPLKKSLLYSDKITLSANENSIALQTAILNFQSSEKNNLQYKLEGFDKNWHTINGGDMIYYSNLPYRTYTLRVRGITDDGKWNGRERSLQIYVRPPFYLSVWAYILYSLLALCCIGYVIYKFRLNILKRHKRAMRIFEQEKERELYHAKIKFFTNITHEIRTPLTLIKGPLENILASSKNLPAKVEENLKVMDLNTNRLLVLVNQLLDFRKTEKGGLKLNLVNTDISSLLRTLCIPFITNLQQRNIHFTEEIADNLQVPVDVEAFTKIISNLLTNAMKHARSYILFKAYLQDEKLIVSITNDGDIIPLSMHEKIFKPFIQYQKIKDKETSGTGLGLTLSRSLAELHHGTLKMMPSEKNNCFILALPLKQAEKINLPNPKEEPVVEKVINKHLDYTLLVVEDNKDMIRFIVQTLAPYYTVLTAGNGKEAIEVLKKKTVNIVISDVMMPEMDGIALCNWIKTTFDYSHIPVILLTAKTALSTKIEGTRSGADAYIEKPFSVEFLKAEITNLLNNRETLRKIFTDSIYVQTNSVTLSKADKDFIKKAHSVVIENLKDPEFKLEGLAKELNMSRASLNRKFKGLMDITPNDYIQAERLKRAAQMLKNGETRINEVCWSCGFNTPSYFTKCFKNKFGVLPKDFANKNKQ